MTTPRSVSLARAPNAGVADKGNGLALPFEGGAVESILENRCGAMIILGDRCHEGVELANTFPPRFRFRLSVDAAREGRRRWLVEERQAIVTQVEHRKLQVAPRGRALDDPRRHGVGESVRPGASDDHSYLKHDDPPIRGVVTNKNRG